MFIQAAYPQSCHEQAEITGCQRHDIKRCDRLVRKRQIEQPPVEKEKDGSTGQECPYLGPGDFFPLDTDCPHAGDGKQQYRQQLGPEYAAEYARCPVEIQQYAVYDLQIQVPGYHARITIHIDVYHQNEYAYGTAKLHDFGKRPQIVFLLHRNIFLWNSGPNGSGQAFRVKFVIFRYHATCVLQVSFSVSCGGGTPLPRNRRLG